MSKRDKIVEFLGEVASQGYSLERRMYYHRLTPSRGSAEDERSLHAELKAWEARITTLEPALGPAIKPWAGQLAGTGTYDIDSIRSKVGALTAIKEAIERDLLVKIEDWVLAEAMDDLLDQADHLLKKKYSLAAGVLGRAVLEEHLRKGCDRKGCIPPGRPTLNDLNLALYNGHHYDKLVMKKVDALTSVGNYCAHNEQPPLAPDKIEPFLRDVREFVTQHTWS